MMTPLIFIGFVVLVIALIVIGQIQAKKRREAFQLLAQELGFHYRQGRDRGVAERFHFLQHLDDGSNRYAENVLCGDLDGQQAYVFDYHYETYSRDSKGHRETNHHWFSVFTLELPERFPELIIKPEGLFSKLGQMLGFDDIDFESHEFSKRYCVKSPDKKFAYDFCNAQMIEFLLAQQNLIIEVDRNILSLTFRGRLAIEQIRPNITRMQRIRSLMPKYLFTR